MLKKYLPVQIYNKIDDYFTSKEDLELTWIRRGHQDPPSHIKYETHLFNPFWSQITISINIDILTLIVRGFWGFMVSKYNFNKY